MHRLEHQPREINKQILLELSYESIMDICEDVEFWWGKIEYELNLYNQPFYDLYQLLTEALQMNRYNYFKAAIQFSKSDNERIHDLFFKYGFMIDDVKIMKLYARNNKHGLIKLYEKKSEKDDKVLETYICIKLRPNIKHDV